MSHSHLAASPKILRDAASIIVKKLKYQIEQLERRVLLAYSPPTGVDLLAAYDTGASNTDDITNLDNNSSAKRLSFDVSGTISGVTVDLYSDGTQIGSATGSDGSTTLLTNGTVDLADGSHAITARNVDSTDSPILGVTIDTTAPPMYSDGSLDLTLDGDGKVTTFLGTDNDLADAMALQPDGKILLAGSSYVGTYADFALVRYNANGALDTTFGGGDGRVTTDVGTRSDFARAMILQPDGKILVAGNSYVGSTYDLALVRYTSTGALDTTFGGGDGIVTTAIGTGAEEVSSMTLQPDGKILLAGSTYSSVTSYDFALVRYNADGSLDTTFGGGNGVVTTAVGTSHDYAAAMALQPDGKILLAGSSHVGSYTDFTLVRYNTDGSLDTAFGSGDGIVTTDIGTRDDDACGMVLLPDGKILVAGNCRVGHSTYYAFVALVRYNTDGSLDSAFGGGDGIATTATSNSLIAQQMALQPDGMILLSGAAGGAIDFALARFTSAGVQDTQFGGGDGIVTTDVAGGDDHLNAMALQPDGKILLAGQSYVGTYSDFSLVRYSGGMAQDLQSASDSGISDSDNITSDNTPTFTISSTDAYFRFYRGGSQISADYAFGSAYTDGARPDGAHAYTLCCVDVAGNLSAFSSSLTVTIDTTPPPIYSDGSLDSSFDVDGKVITPVGTSHDYASAMALQPNGKVLIAGYSRIGSYTDFALVRYNTDGTVDTSFGAGDGIVTTNFFGYDDIAKSVAIQPDGKIVVAGYSYDSTTSNTVCALARYTADGGPDTTFSGDGKVTMTFVDNYNYFMSVAVQPDGKIVAVGYEGSGVATDWALARFTTTGSLDTTFTSDGKVTTDLSGARDVAYSVALQADGKIVVGGGYHDGTNYRFAVARYTAAGALDTTFSGNGWDTAEPGGSATNLAYSVAVQTDGKIILAGAAGGDVALVRWTTTGSIDTTFSEDGHVTTDFGGSDQVARSVLVQPDGKIVAAGWTDAGGGYDFALARYTTTGAPDTTFGGNGSVTTPVGTGEDRTYGIALQPDGRILVAGYTGNGSNYDFALARYAGSSTLSPKLQTASDSGVSPIDNITNDNTPTLDVTSTDAYYRCFRDGSQITEDFATAGSVTDSPRADGICGYTMQSVDAAGNPSSVSPVLSVIIDTASPSITAPAAFQVDASTQRIVYVFNENVVQTLTPLDWTLQNLTTASSLPSESMAVDYDSGTNTANLRFPGYASGVLPDGNYQATLFAAGVTDTAGNLLSADIPLEFSFLQADANRDRKVNTLDFNLLAGNFGGGGKAFSQGDFDYSGIVDSVDFGILLSQYGKSLPGPSSIRGLIAWYDADTLGLADGASVSAWTNAQGDHGLDLVAGGIAPTYIAATEGHHAGVQFGYSTPMGSLNNLGLSGDPDFTVVFAGRITALAAQYNHPWSWGNGAEGGHPGGCAELEIQTTDSGPRVDLATGWGWDGMTPDGSMPMSSDVLVTFAKPAGPINTVKIWIDQVAQTVTGSSAIPTIIDTPFYLGPVVGAQSPEMVVNEVLIYNRALSDDEIASVHSYLAGEMGVP